MGRLLIAFTLLAACVPSAAIAQGTGGDPHDRLDWPGSPTDRYLTSDEVRDRLHENTQGFFECFRASLRSKPEGGASVTFAVHQDGKAQSIEVDPGKAPETLRPCVASVVAGIDFRTHDGDPLDVSYPLVYEVDTRGARILPYPIVFTKPRPIRLPLLTLPLDTTPGEMKMLEVIFTRDAPPKVEVPAEPADELGEAADASPVLPDEPEE